jgi:RNA recognition motif-containing protein
MTKLSKAIDELNGATVQGRAIVVNKSEPKPEGERRSFNNNSRGGDSVVMVVETAVVETTVVVETEEDINIFSSYKKGVNEN